MSVVRSIRKIDSFHCMQFGVSDRSRPAVLWLHGIGERGVDISLVARFGLPAAMLAGRAVTNATVVCPQLEANAEWEASRVQSLLSDLKKQHSEVVLVGFSFGGLGVCDLLCRGGSVARLNVVVAGRARDLPNIDQSGVQFLAISGELDPWPQMGRFVQRVAELGGAAEEHIIAGQGHFISESGLMHPRFVELAAGAGVEMRISKNGVPPLHRAG